MLSPAFYALGDARTPMYISLLSVLINAGVAFGLTRYTGMGHAGLALSTSAVAIFGFVLQFWIIRGRIGGVYGRDLAASVLKIAVASAVMGGVVWVSTHLMAARFGVSQFGRLADLCVSLPAGLAAFYAACRVLKVPDLDAALNALARPVMRRLNRQRPGTV